MTPSPARRAARRAVLLSAPLVAAAVLAAGPAGAVTVGTGSALSFSGEAGDYISGGQAWSYDPTTATFGWTASGDHALTVTVSGSAVWSARITAPTGQSLVAGSTYRTERFETPAVGTLDLDGDGRGCNQTFGELTVRTAKFGPHNWVEEFDAGFVQHCESPDAPALTGEIRIVNGPAPAELAVRANASATAKVIRASGRAVVGGSVTCNRPAQVTLTGDLAQRRSRTALATGTWTSVPVHCGTTPTRWTASVKPSGAVPFGTGKAEVTATWTAQDDVYGVQPSGDLIRLVTLKV
jgi:hypothetical protein